MAHYEEDRNIPQLWGWLILLGLASLLIGWCMFLMVMIPDQPRKWDFGTFPDAPAESIYSTAPPPPSPQVQEPQSQISPLPESKKWTKPERAGKAYYKDTPWTGEQGKRPPHNSEPPTRNSMP